ncbi:MAG: hypothetical protein KJO07_24835 [Deltaproteobacteria bacterium]|nr:hypothetical protein [Deltaproteobacteria bacterium]
MNGIEQDLEGRAKVIRLNMLSEVGQKAAERFEVRAIPTLVALDGEEKILYRQTGVPNRGEVVAVFDRTD